MDVVVPPATLQLDLKKMINNPLGSDVKLVAGDDGFALFAHKIILISRSEVFRAMLTTGMRESLQASIELPDMDQAILLLLMEFIYTDTVEISAECAIPLFVVADKYRVERLQRMCESFILKSLDVDNVCQIFETSDALNATQLRGIW